MNRLQKKCVIGTVGIHLLLLAILIVGPAFFNSQPKTDDATVLDVIPANLVDAAVNSGVQNAHPPAPTPIVRPPQPQPPQPQPAPAPRIVQPPAPAPTPTPSFLTRVERYFKPTTPTPAVTPDLTPVAKRTTASQDNIKISLTKVKRTHTQNSSQADNPQNARAINNALKALKSSLSSATKIDMPGNANAAYAYYGNAVLNAYQNAWVPPDGMASDNVTVKFKVTIARDGTVLSAHIVESSGDPNVDAAVQRMLDRVNFIAPFPEGTDDKERIYPIEFTATRTTE